MTVEPARTTGAVTLYIRLLGFIYLCALVSLLVQVDGLLGPNGIAPVDWLLTIFSGRGTSRFFYLPTLLWIDDSPLAMHLLLWAGCALAGLVIFGRLVRPALALLWLIYLSFVAADHVFLQFQWDYLLLEAGLLAPFLMYRRPSGPVVSGHVVFLHRWLLFRLMFSSGFVKLASGDAAWRSLTALDYHYFTQPIPNAVAYYAHHLPEWFQKFSVLSMFGIELVVPFFIFLGRRLRLTAFFLLVGLQLLIASTGNFAFFNLLSLALCVLLLDDGALARFSRLGTWRPKLSSESDGEPARRAPAYILALTLFVLVVSASEMGRLVAGPGEISSFCDSIVEWAAPLRSINGYGLFAVMTTERLEIQVEGSDDGEHWKDYVFPYKPQDLEARPRQVAPHQPRLDWQMWFAALSSVRQNPWFLSFVRRLLLGTPEVVALMTENPFPEHPPKLIRAELYRYTFTSLAEKAAGKGWWQRELVGLYLPPVSLDQLRMAGGRG